jgi:peptidoglycan-synthase activator LpoB
MLSLPKATLSAGLLLAIVGCYSDRPHEYGEQRPPVDRIDERDRGLQSKDVVSASDQMAMDLMALPELQDSRSRWTIVVDRVENLTAERRQDLDIFLERLRVNLAKHGRGRVQLIENRDKLRDLQSRELEVGSSDRYGQTGSKGGAPAGIQPDFALYGRIMEMPNRATSYFLCEFTLLDLHTREQVWTNAYEVKVLR